MPNQLVTIDADTFYEGMKIGTSIYYKYGYNLVLLCNKTVLDSELIRQLRHCQDMGWDLYVFSRDVDALKADSWQHQRSVAKADNEEKEKGKEKEKKEQAARRPKDEPPKHLKRMEEKMQIRREYKALVNEVEEGIKALQHGKPLPASFTKDATDLVEDRLQNLEASTLVQCINMMRRVDSYLYIHSVNVSILNGLFGQWMGMGQEDIDRLIRTGLLHDIGQCKVPPHILNKPAKLTVEEYEIVKKHPIYSFEMAYETGERDTEVLSGVRGHHERMNGSGYPDGLSGDHICLFARITAISDVYDAMVSNRNFRERHSPFEVLHQFELSRFSDLDIELIDLFLEKMPLELVDKWVDLSNGQRGKVVHIFPGDAMYPLVKVKDKIIQTGPDLYCVGMSDFLSVY